MHAGNLCGCGMNEMVVSDLGIERILAMAGCACITSHFAGFDLAGGAMPYVKIVFTNSNSNKKARGQVFILAVCVKNLADWGGSWGRASICEYCVEVS
jgi:hypothetical protein